MAIDDFANRVRKRDDILDGPRERFDAIGREGQTIEKSTAKAFGSSGFEVKLIGGKNGGGVLTQSGGNCGEPSIFAGAGGCGK